MARGREGLKSVLKTIRDWYAARDIDLNFSLQEAPRMQKQGSVKERIRLEGHVLREFMSACLSCQMHWDDTGAGRLAMAAIFSQVAFKRCLRHQLQAVRRRTGPEEVRGKHCVIDSVHCQSFSLRSPLAVRAPKARVCGCGLGGVRVGTCQRRGPKTGPP